MIKQIVSVCFMALVVCALPRTASAQANGAPLTAQGLDQGNVKGLKSLGVLIEALPDGAKALGLTEDMLQTDVELKLRLAGLRVLPMKQAEAVPGSPHIYVAVNLTDDSVAASIDVAIHENATLERNGHFAIAVDTWTKGITVEHPTADGLRERVKDLIDAFLDDWLAANPKS